MSISSTHGSPPRVWGRRVRGTRGRPEARFTPTCVGKALGQPQAAAVVSVHPHVCGEGASDGENNRSAHGSPPRVWGRPRREALGRGRGRFTPTCVGKAQSWRRGCRLCTVHPHVCGEGPTSPNVRPARSGSPPRVWGRRRRSGLESEVRRFTPTCVGKASGTRPRPPRGTSRFTPTCVGKANASVVPDRRSTGSPPRVWGRRPWRRGSGRFRAVHPHVCGEGEDDPGRHGVQLRFTPTCVGKALGMYHFAAGRQDRYPGVAGIGAEVLGSRGGLNVVTRAIPSKSISARSELPLWR